MHKISLLSNKSGFDIAIPMLKVLPLELQEKIQLLREKFSKPDEQEARQETILECLNLNAYRLDQRSRDTIFVCLEMQEHAEECFAKIPCRMFFDLFQALRSIYQFEEQHFAQNLKQKIVAAKKLFLVQVAKRENTKNFYTLASNFLSKAVKFLLNNFSSNLLYHQLPYLMSLTRSDFDFPGINMLDTAVKFALPKAVFDEICDIEMDQRKFYFAKILHFNEQRRIASPFIKLYDYPTTFMEEFVASKEKAEIITTLFSEWQVLHEYAIQKATKAQQKEFAAALESFKTKVKFTNPEDKNLLLPLLSELISYIEKEVFNAAIPE